MILSTFLMARATSTLTSRSQVYRGFKRACVYWHDGKLVKSLWEPQEDTDE